MGTYMDSSGEYRNYENETVRLLKSIAEGYQNPESAAAIAAAAAETAAEAAAAIEDIAESIPQDYSALSATVATIETQAVFDTKLSGNNLVSYTITAGKWYRLYNAGSNKHNVTVKNGDTNVQSVGILKPGATLYFKANYDGDTIQFYGYSADANGKTHIATGDAISPQGLGGVYTETIYGATSSATLYYDLLKGTRYRVKNNGSKIAYIRSKNSGTLEERFGTVAAGEELFFTPTVNANQFDVYRAEADSSAEIVLTCGVMVDTQSRAKDNETALEEMAEATGAAAGKLLTAKTVADGSVTEWEYTAQVEIDSTLTQTGEAADAKATGDGLADVTALVGKTATGINEEVWQGFVRYDFPSAFTWTSNPVADKITTDGKGRFRVDYNVLDHISTTGVDVYIAPTGSDSNDGLSALTPKKTLGSAIEVTNARRVHIAGGYYPREEITLSADIDLLGDPENRAVFTGQNANSTWTATATTGVYTTDHKNYGVVYDLTNTYTGTHRQYTEAASVAAVQSSEGTYYDDGTTMTIHTYGDEEPTLDKVCYAQGWSALRVLLKGHTALAAHLCFTCSGTYSGRGQLMFVGDDTDRGSFLLYNCDSSYSIRPSGDNISGGSAINPSKADGIVQYCTAYHAGNDGFSYGAGCKVVEIGCASAYNGTDDITSCNGSTAHGGSYIRINGAYHDTHGPIVHDVGATESVNLGLAAWHSTCEGKPNFCASGGAVKMWLDSCVGYSSDAGIDVGKDGEPAANAVIYKRNCTSDVADAEYGGHIYRY